MVDQATNERTAQRAADGADKYIRTTIRLAMRDVARIGITIGPGSCGSRSGKARRHRQHHRDAHAFRQSDPFHVVLLESPAFT
jgi:hypothetical protein